jgi:hypothetical protein
VTMRNDVFWDVTQCGSCKKRRFRGMYHLYHQGDKIQRAGNNVSNNFLRSVLRLLLTANVLPSSSIFLTLTMGYGIIITNTKFR